MFEVTFSMPHYQVQVITIYSGDDLYYRFEKRPGTKEFKLRSLGTRLATDEEWAEVKKRLSAFVSPSTGLSQASQELPEIMRPVVNPVTGYLASLWNTVITLNDEQKWTREQIADWIETLDPVPTFTPKEKQDEYGISITNLT